MYTQLTGDAADQVGGAEGRGGDGVLQAGDEQQRVEGRQQLEAVLVAFFGFYGGATIHRERDRDAA
jgi:hypothetical protein